MVSELNEKFASVFSLPKVGVLSLCPNVDMF